MEQDLSNSTPPAAPHRRKRQRGSEMLEFTMVMLPLMGFLTVTTDMAWSIFVKSTVQRAVRVGVRQGVTLTSGQMTNGACLTDTVKGIVQSNSMGLLSGTAGLAKIKVHYYKPPLATSTGTTTDVTSQADGNTPGNIMQIQVLNYSLVPLLPRIFNWKETPDNNPLVFTAASADKIEPSRNPPCKGTAP